MSWDSAEMPEVLADWTAHMYGRHRALHHVDVRAGAWIYRVFLLASTLQVDLAFVSASEFRALAPTFRLVFGEANAAQHVPPPPAGDIIALAGCTHYMRGSASPDAMCGRRNT